MDVELDADVPVVGVVHVCSKFMNNYPGNGACSE